MTPAITLLDKLKIPYTLHQYQHQTDAASYGEEAAELLQLPYGQVFKTLITQVVGGKQAFAVAILPVNRQLSLKQLALCLKAKKAEMADPKDAVRMTGYLPGGISPLGQKGRLPKVIDESALDFDKIFVSAGRRGLEVELNVSDLVQVIAAKVRPIATPPKMD